MVLQSMGDRASRITRFATVQFIALVGWIIVQSLFTLSPPGRTIPFPVIMVIEAIWWIATLVIMFLLFKRVQNSFVQAVLDLEEANKRLRHTTNTALSELIHQNDQEEGVPKPDPESDQEEGVPKPDPESDQEEGVPNPDPESDQEEGVPKPDPERS